VTGRERGHVAAMAMAPFAVTRRTPREDQSPEDGGEEGVAARDCLRSSISWT